MEIFDAEEEALKVKECAEEVLRLFGEHFPDNPAYAYTVLVYLLVRITESLDVNPDFVMRSIRESFEVHQLLKAEVPNEFIN